MNWSVILVFIFIISPSSWGARPLLFWQGQSLHWHPDLSVTAHLDSIDSPLYRNLGFEDLEPKISNLIQDLDPIQSDEPLILVIDNSMTVNASYRISESGPDVLTIHLGLLLFVDSDDELKAAIGHEFQHSQSKLNHGVRNNLAFQSLFVPFGQKYLANLQNTILNRMAESEVDLRATIFDLYQKKNNPTAMRRLLIKLGNEIEGSTSTPHSNINTRISASESLLLIMKRRYGIRFDAQNFTHELINSELRGHFLNPSFTERQFERMEAQLLAQIAEIAALKDFIYEGVQTNSMFSPSPRSTSERTPERVRNLIQSISNHLSLGSASELVDKGFHGLISKNRKAELILKIQCRLLGAIEDLRKDVMAKLKPIEVLIWPGSNILFPSVETPNWKSSIKENVTLTQFIDLEMLNQKQHVLKWRLENKDFTTYSYFDESTSEDMVRRELAGIDDLIEKGKNNLYEHLDQWYNFRGQIDEIIQKIQDGIEAYLTKGRGHTYPDEIRVLPNLIEPYQKEVGPFIRRQRDTWIQLFQSKQVKEFIKADPLNSISTSLISNALRIDLHDHPSFSSIAKSYLVDLNAFLRRAAYWDSSELTRYYSSPTFSNIAFISDDKGYDKIIYLATLEIQHLLRLDHFGLINKEIYDGLPSLFESFFHLHRRTPIQFLSMRYDSVPLFGHLHTSQTNLVTINSSLRSIKAIHDFIDDLARTSVNSKIILKQAPIRKSFETVKDLFKYFDDVFLPLTLNDRYRITSPEALKAIDLFSFLFLPQKIESNDGHFSPLSKIGESKAPDFWVGLYMVHHWKLFYKADPEKTRDQFTAWIESVRRNPSEKWIQNEIEHQLPLYAFVDYAQLMHLSHSALLALLHEFQWAIDGAEHSLSPLTPKESIEFLNSLAIQKIKDLPPRIISLILHTYKLESLAEINERLLPFGGSLRDESESKNLKLYLERNKSIIWQSLQSRFNPDDSGSFNFSTIENAKQSSLWVESIFSNYLDAPFLFYESLSLKPRERLNLLLALIERLTHQTPNLDSLRTVYRVNLIFDKILPVSFYSDLDPYSFEEKRFFLKTLFRFQLPKPKNDLLFENLRAEGQRYKITIRDFLEPIWIQGLFFNANKLNLALEQIEYQFHLPLFNETPVLNQKTKYPPRAIRPLLPQILDFVDQQFNTWSPTREIVLNRIEDHLATTPAETRLIVNHRWPETDWASSSKVAVLSLPSEIESKIESTEDLLELIEFLIGERTELPSLFERSYRKSLSIFQINFRDNPNSQKAQESQQKILKLHKSLESAFIQFKNIYTAQSLTVRAAILSQFLNSKNLDTLNSSFLKPRLHKLMMGDLANDWLISEIVLAYMQSAPEEQFSHLTAYLISTQTDHKINKRRTIRPLCQALGAFGDRLAQFLYSSGILDSDLTSDLDDYITTPRPLLRYEVVHLLEKSFGFDLPHITHIGSTPNSGAINIVVEVDFELNGQHFETMVRLRRPFLEGLNENENEILMNFDRHLRSISTEDRFTPEQKQRIIYAANVIDEGRRQAFEYLRPGGRDLNLQVEREIEALADVYVVESLDRPLESFRIRPIKHIPELQSLVRPEMQTLASVYPRIHIRPLDSISDPKARKAVAIGILRAELNALFKYGIFDPDVHLGNWLIDFIVCTIFRIDYAQILDLDPTPTTHNKDEIQKFIFMILNSKPRFQSPEEFALLLRIFDFPHDSKVSIEMFKGESIALPSGIQNPFIPIFELRKQMIEIIERKSGLHLEIQYQQPLRAALAAVAKLKKLSQYMSASEFKREFLKHDPNHPHLAFLLKLQDKLSKHAGLWSNKLNTNLKTAPLPTLFDSAEPPPSKETSTQTHINSLNYQLASIPTEPLLKGDIFLQNSGSPEDIDPPSIRVFHDHVELNLDWALEEYSNTGILPITQSQFNVLPLGTILHYRYHHQDVQKQVFLGVDHLSDFSIFSDLISYGVSIEDYHRFGGPQRRAFPHIDLRMFDWSTNKTVITPMGTRILLLTQNQFDQLPSGSYLVSIHNTPHIKGESGDPIQLLEPDQLWLNVGIPDSEQHGFGDVGVPFREIFSWNPKNQHCALALKTLTIPHKK